MLLLINPEPSVVLSLTQPAERGSCLWHSLHNMGLLCNSLQNMGPVHDSLQNVDDACQSYVIADLCFVENYFIWFLRRRQSLTFMKIQASATGTIKNQCMSLMCIWHLINVERTSEVKIYISCMLHWIKWYIVPSNSDDHGAFIFRVKQSKETKWTWKLKYYGSLTSWSCQTFQKTWIISSAAERTLHLAACEMLQEVRSLCAENSFWFPKLMFLCSGSTLVMTTSRNVTFCIFSSYLGHSFVILHCCIGLVCAFFNTLWYLCSCVMFVWITQSFAQGVLDCIHLW
jgi:hypothetical protein